MKTNKTYSINVKVVEAFEDEMGDENKSRMLEALMIEFLLKYTRETNPSVMVKDSSVSPKEIL